MPKRVQESICYFHYELGQHIRRSLPLPLDLQYDMMLHVSCLYKYTREETWNFLHSVINDWQFYFKDVAAFGPSYTLSGLPK